MSLLLRDSWQSAWQLAVDLTVEELQGADLQERCEKSGAVWRPEDGVAEITFLNRAYWVRPPEFEVALSEGEGEVPLTEKVLILHYLKTASGIPLSGEWITFAQVPGGEIYLSVFRARSIDRLVRAFDGRETTLMEAARSMGGREAEYGEMSVQVRAFPRVPVTLILWLGDDEIPSSGNLLFDATVTEYLPMEDMVVLAGMTVSRLCKYDKGG